MNKALKVIPKCGNSLAKQIFRSHSLLKYVCRHEKKSLYSSSTSQEYMDFVSKLGMYNGGNVTLDCNDNTGVGVILLDNPARKNALTGSMMVQLEKIVSQLEQWDSGKAVVLYGTEKMFCSGGDLKILMQHLRTAREGAYMCQFMQDTLYRFSQLPLISIAVIQGMALGGGAELATACDFRLMHKSAAIQFVQSIMGITTGWGGGSRLVNIVGRKRALQLLLTANKVNYGNALDIGLIDSSISDYVDPIDYAIDWLDQQNFLSKNIELTRAIKKFVDFSSTHSMQDSYIYERQLFEQFWQGDLHKSALSKNIRHR